MPRIRGGQGYAAYTRADMTTRPAWALALALLFLVPAARAQEDAGDVTLRAAVFEVGEIRTRDLLTPDSPRLKRLAEIVQRTRPNILLLSGISYDTPGGPDVKPGEAPGQNGQRFADSYLAVPQAEGLGPLKLKSFMAPVNSGMASGMDLDHNGRIVTEFPEPGSGPVGGLAASYSGDCWGAGAYPGQCGMALLVDERLTIEADKSRTFRKMPWDYVLGSMIPPAAPGSDAKSWYTDRERLLVRLSSVGHWDVPVALPNGAVVHILCSRPATPTGDSPPTFATRRNHDEIRLWADYIEDAGYLVDDADRAGGIQAGSSFVLLGNLGRSPEPKAGPDDVITTVLYGARGVNHEITPESPVSVPGLDMTATTFGNVRADYVLPSRDLGIAAAGIWRSPPSGGGTFPSDHFPVWMDLVIRAPAPPPNPESRPKP